MQNGIASTIGLQMTKEADFYIHELKPIEVFGTTVYITTTHICTILLMLVIIAIAVMARRSVIKAQFGTPTKFATVTEMAVSTLNSFVSGTMGQAGQKYINYIGAIFIFILFANISGVFGFRPPTADFATTFCLALITFTMIQYANIRYNKFGAFTNLFKPMFLFFPINVISEFAIPISLSLRLFGNIMAGTVMMSLYYGMLPWFIKLGIPAALHVYFDLFSGAIQAYVFCMLTMTFVSDKRNGQ